MQLRNIEPFSQYVPGDVVEVPDGAAFDPLHWEAFDGAAGTQPGMEADTQASAASASAPAAPASPALPVPLIAAADPKEM